MPLGPKIPLSIALAAEVPQSSMNNGRDPTGNGQASDPTVVARVVFQTQDPEPLVELLRRALNEGRSDPASHWLRQHTNNH